MSNLSRKKVNIIGKDGAEFAKKAGIILVPIQGKRNVKKTALKGEKEKA